MTIDIDEKGFRLCFANVSSPIKEAKRMSRG
jgi:hypothetical protein